MHKIRYCCLLGNCTHLSSYRGVERKQWHVVPGDGLTDYRRITSFLEGHYDFVYDPRQPDLVILKVTAAKPPMPILPFMFYKLAVVARRMWGRAPLLISSCYEAIPLELRNLDRVYSSQPPAPGNISCGFAGDILFAKNSPWLKYRGQPKSKFCNYLYANDALPLTNVRRAFCKIMMRYKHIDAPGMSLNNMQLPDNLAGKKNLLAETWTKKLFFIKNYKFTIAFENRVSPGYVTEKIEHPLAVGSIPIYRGSPNIGDYYNPKSFINCRDYASFDEVVERVIEIDNNPTLYREYIKAPPVLPGSHFDALARKMLAEWDILYAEICRRRPPGDAAPGGIWATRTARLGWMLLRNADHDLAYLSFVASHRLRRLKEILRRS